MPEVHFVGEVASADIEDGFFSVTWAIVPGNAAWSLTRGISAGETQSGGSCDKCGCLLNHPIDVNFESASAEGCPVFICEVMRYNCTS